MTLLSPRPDLSLPFYLSGPLPCPYLPGRVERKLFARLSGDKKIDGNINAALTRAGFRRSHDIVYRPACQSCSACMPVRIPVKTFRLSRSLRRIEAKNRDLMVSVRNPESSDELYEVFLEYQTARHADSDMARMTRAEFEAMLQEGKSTARIYQLREKTGRLVGAMISDNVQDGLSAVYSFFRPSESRRSLGTQLILTLIAEAKKANLPYVYLGYWIEASRKMAYKSRFQPLQTLSPEGWALLTSDI
jgi:leucyl-tRNA---protein transferase